MKKRVLGLLLCMVLLVLGGCGSNKLQVLTPQGNAVIQEDDYSIKVVEDRRKDDKKQENMMAGDNTTTNSNLIRVGFAQVGSESGWRLAQTASMKETFSEKNGYQLDFVDCNNDQATQIRALSKFITDGVSYIILDPIVETGYDDILKKCKDANIPVIVVDRNISADASLYTCWVGSDFTKEGEAAAEWLDSYLKQKNIISGDVNIVTILGTGGASATLGRTKGFANVAANHSNWKLLDEQSGDFTKDGGNAVMRAFLKQHSDINVVVCQNDDEAFGAVEAMKDAGLTCGPNGDITVISFDATKAGFQSMIAGDINVDVECNPLEGPLVAELIQKLKNGQSVEKIQYVKEGIYPAETVAETIGSRSY